MHVVKDRFAMVASKRRVPNCMSLPELQGTRACTKLADPRFEYSRGCSITIESTNIVGNLVTTTNNFLRVGMPDRFQG